MENLNPTNLQDYCRLFNISIFDLNIQCIFCRFVLDLEHLASFYNKNLSLVWRDSNCFACCISCCRLSAKFERENHYQCSVRSVDLETILQKPLHAVVVRCYECLRLLDLVEKYDCVCRDDYMHLIRSSWKALCRYCVQK